MTKSIVFIFIAMMGCGRLSQHLLSCNWQCHCLVNVPEKVTKIGSGRDYVSGRAMVGYSQFAELWFKCL